jgi:hypothetical protein
MLPHARSDIGFAVDTGEKPLFFTDGVPWDAYLADSSNCSNPKGASSAATIIHKVCPNPPDHRLVNVWLDLREFCTAANLAVQTKLKIDAKLFQEVVLSVNYRLLLLEYDDKASVDEAILRLGMLAFSITAFLQIPQMPVRYVDLTAKLRRSVLLLPCIGQQYYQRIVGQHDGEVDMAVFLRLKLWFLSVAYRHLSLPGGPEGEGDLLAWLVYETLVSLGLFSFFQGPRVGRG